jgi:OOP family OmpA-OmpF porin
MEQAPANTGQVEVYDIYFSYNSAQIRQESEPRLKEIAAVLNKHPEWKLSVNGHTDSIANDSYNLELSGRRAAAVKNELVERYAIDAARLVTAGFGESQPKDTNDTLEGRARNRRVELVRV